MFITMESVLFCIEHFFNNKTHQSQLYNNLIKIIKKAQDNNDSDEALSSTLEKFQKDYGRWDSDLSHEVNRWFFLLKDIHRYLYDLKKVNELPKGTTDYISSMSNDVVGCLFEYLSPNSLKNLSKTSNFWKSKVKFFQSKPENILKAVHLRRHRMNYSLLPELITHSLPEEDYVNFATIVENNLLILGLFNGRLLQCSFDSKGKWSIEELPGMHSKKITTIITIPNGIASASQDGTIKIWKFEEKKYKCTQVLLEEKVDATPSLALLDNGDIVSGSSIGLTIWHFEDDKYVPIHTETIILGATTIVPLKNGNFLCTQQSKLLVWNYENKTYVPKPTLDMKAYISHLVYRGEDIFVSSIFSNSLVIIKMASNNQCGIVQTLNAHEDNVRCFIRLENGDLITSGWKDKVKIWRKENNAYVCVQTLKVTVDGQCNAKLIPLKDDMFASSSYHSAIKIWSRENGKYSCRNTFNHGQPIGSNLVFMSIDDKIVTLTETKQTQLSFFRFPTLESTISLTDLPINRP